MYLLISSPLNARVDENGDIQFWSQNSFDFTIKKEFGTRLTEEMRWGDNVSTLYYVYGQAQLYYKTEHVEIAPGYRQSFINLDNQWYKRSVPFVDVTFFLKDRWDFNCSWDFEDRNRLMVEIREMGDGRAVWVYRNRLRALSPQFIPYLKLKLFVEDELFFVEWGGFSENRLGLGFLARLLPCVSSRLYYTLRSLNREEKWIFQHVVNFHFHFNF